MIPPLPCAAVELLPHRGNMLLLRSLEQWGERRAVASASADDARLFQDSQGRPDCLALIEMAAQTVFAWTGWRDRALSAQPVGYLAGLRDFRLLSAPLPGEPMCVRCQEVLRISGSAVVEAEVHGETDLLATGRLHLVENEAGSSPHATPPREITSPLPHPISPPSLPEELLAAVQSRSPLAQSLLRSLEHFAPCGAGHDALVRFGFRAGFPAFDGHFPGRPLLPGVALLEAARLACEIAAARPLELAEVARAKFVWPVKPESELTFAVRAEEGFPRAHVQISHGAQPVADVTLCFREFAREERPS